MKMLPRISTLIFAFALFVALSNAGRWTGIVTDNTKYYPAINNDIDLIGRTSLVFAIQACEAADMLFYQYVSSGSFVYIRFGEAANTYSFMMASPHCTVDGCQIGAFNEAAHLHCDEFRMFWARWNNWGKFEVGVDAVVGSNLLMEMDYNLNGYDGVFELRTLEVSAGTENYVTYYYYIDEEPTMLTPQPGGGTVVNVAEDAPIGYFLSNTTGTDPEGDLITFGIDGNYTDIFGWEEGSSEYILNATLDYETQKVYYVELGAHDGFNVIFNSMTVLVSDVDDEPPVVTPGTLTLLEELEVGTAVHGAFIVTDPDTNQDFTYAVSGADAAFFSFVGSDLTLAKRIDQESVTTLTITVTVTDSASHTGQTDLTFTVVDINDNDPVCDADMYFLTIAEGTTDENIKLKDTIICTDADDGDNAIVSASVVSGDVGGIFYMTGLELWGSPKLADYEALSGDGYSFYLTVHVVDNPTSGPAMTGTVFFVVEVTGANEFDPTWDTLLPDGSGNFPAVTVLEDSLYGSELVTYSATDADHGVDGDVFFEIVSITDDLGGDGSGLFAVDHKSGVLRTAGSLDSDGGVSSYDIVVKAVDGGATPREVTGTQRINLAGVNDNPPNLDSVPAEVTVSEDATISTVIETFVITDADAEDTVTVTLKAGSPTEFTVVGMELQTVATLDYETTQCYTLVISATDGAHTGEKAVAVRVTDVNDVTPVITPSATLVIQEGLPVGTVLYGLFSVTDPDIGDTFTSTVSGTDAASFTTAASGDLEIASLVTATGTTLTVDITVTDAASNAATETLVITVEDINDNAPVCDRGIYEVTVQEGSGGNSLLFGPLTCTDADSGANANMIAKVVGGDPDSIFSFNSLELWGTPNNIDYESLEGSDYQYRLEVEVEDEPTEWPAKTSSLLIIVTVTGTNEHAPVFTTPALTGTDFDDISVSEGDGPGTVVGVYTANDADHGMDGIVQYEIVSIKTDADVVVTEEFWIDSDSGTLYVGKELDADGGIAYYTVVIKAVDLGGTPREVEGSQRILITGVNDNAPVFTVSHDVTVSEAEVKGYVVVDVTMTDADGDTPTLTLGGPNAATFSVSGSQILLENSLDYDDDTKSCISLELTASDTVHSTFTTLTVTVDPANDEEPVITVNSDPKMPEELPIGFVVWGIFTTSDPDVGDTFTYSVGGTDGSYFTIDVDGGLVIASRVDREAGLDSLSITVSVEDANSHTVSEDITIGVLDINDNAPLCSKVQYIETVNEGSTSTDGKILDAITCTDADTGTNADMAISITDGDAGNLFYYKADWELWGALDQIDYEGLSTSDYMYRLVVEVVDQPTDVAAHTSTVLVLLKVTGTNEFTPEIVTPTPTSGTFPEVTTDENTLPGTTLVTYTASDDDHGIDGEVTFAIVSVTSDTGVNAPDAFIIDPKGGNLRVGELLDADAATGGVAYYDVVVRALDGGTTPKSAEYTQRITLTGINDNVPRVTDTELAFTVAEDSAAAVLVGSLTLEDDDGDVVTLGVTGTHAAVFEGHASQPDILVSAPSLDYETTKCYSVEVSITDGTFTVKTTVTVAISDVIDTAPVLTPLTSVTMAEELSTGTAIGKLFQLADPDVADTWTYTIAGTDGGKFTIDAPTGRVFVNAAIDADGGGSPLSVTVTAEDGAALTGDANIDIAVVDINEFAPAFGDNVYTASVAENSASAKILDVTCTDSDTGANGDVELVVPSTDGADTIFSVSGMEVHADGTLLDYESLSGSGYVYTMVLLCKDKPTQGVPLTGSVLVIVEVTGVEETAPDWSSPTPDGSGNFPGIEVAESTEPGTSLQVFVATDLDHGLDGTITYSIVSVTADTGADGSDYFRIQASTGSLETALFLDYEGSVAYYDIVVQASDGMNDITGTLRVTLTDVSDNPPKFTDEFSSAYIPCTQTEGATILTLAATDVDTVGTNDFAFKSYSGDFFDLDPISGTITLATKPTRVGSDIYHTLNVLATDTANGDLVDEATVDIVFEYCGPITTTTAEPATTQPSGCTPTTDSTAVVPVRVVTAVLAVMLVGLVGFSLRSLFPNIRPRSPRVNQRKKKLPRREFERPVAPEPELVLEDYY